MKFHIQLCKSNSSYKCCILHSVYHNRDRRRFQACIVTGTAEHVITLAIQINVTLWWLKIMLGYHSYNIIIVCLPKGSFLWRHDIATGKDPKDCKVDCSVVGACQKQMVEETEHSKSLSNTQCCCTNSGSSSLYEISTRSVRPYTLLHKPCCYRTPARH